MIKVIGSSVKHHISGKLISIIRRVILLHHKIRDVGSPSVYRISILVNIESPKLFRTSGSFVSFDQATLNIHTSQNINSCIISAGGIVGHLHILQYRPVVIICIYTQTTISCRTVTVDHRVLHKNRSSGTLGININTAPIFCRTVIANCYILNGDRFLIIFITITSSYYINTAIVGC